MDSRSGQILFCVVDGDKFQRNRNGPHGIDNASERDLPDSGRHSVCSGCDRSCGPASRDIDRHINDRFDARQRLYEGIVHNSTYITAERIFAHTVIGIADLHEHRQRKSEGGQIMRIERNGNEFRNKD